MGMLTTVITWIESNWVVIVALVALVLVCDLVDLILVAFGIVRPAGPRS
jgi:hypothetical protein